MSEERLTPQPTLRPDGVFAWGDIVDVDLIIDLVSMINQSRRTAVVTVVCGAVRKSVYFRAGAVMAASSNLIEDRFGDIMFRRGLITREQLDSALLSVGPGKKIGNVLMARGLLDSSGVWKGIKLQIEEIFHSVLLIESGQFTVAAFDPAQVPTRTTLDTQHMLLEGLRRKDEMANLRASLPAADRVLARGAATAVELDSAERVVVGLVDGRRTVRSLIHLCGLGEFAAVEALHRLLRAGVLVESAGGLETGAGLGEAEGTSVSDIIDGYNEAFARIFTALGDLDPQIRQQASLASYFADAEDAVQEIFDGLEFGPDGRVPLEPLYANLKVNARPDKVSTLRRGLKDYLRYLLFVAREVLPFAEVETLAGEVRAVTER